MKVTHVLVGVEYKDGSTGVHRMSFEQFAKLFVAEEELHGYSSSARVVKRTPLVRSDHVVTVAQPEGQADE